MSAALPTQDAAADAFDPFQSGAVERVVATSAAQREVWLADRLGREASLAFNESITLTLAGRLDAHAMRRALDAVVTRHATLRATFAPDGTQMLIGVTPPMLCPLDDLGAAQASDRSRRLDAAVMDAVETPFDLERGPLFRARLFRLGASDHRLLLMAHHIVCDGWSWGVIVSELASLYAAACDGGDAPGLPPADDWSDYVRWEREQSSGASGEAHERWWLSRFPPGDVPVLELPTDRPRATQRGFRSRRIDHVMSAPLVADVQRVGGALGASAFATLFAAFAAMLGRLTAQSDVVVGVPSAGQASSGLGRLVGHAVNLLPVRTDPRAAEPFSGFLRRTAGTLLDAFDHAALTYGSLLALLPVGRDPSRLPLVSVMFNLDPSVAATDAFAGLQAAVQVNPRRYENFELFVNAVRLADGGIRLECQYSADLFDAATVARWLRCYETMLGGIVRDAGAAIGSLPLLAKDDEAELAALRGRAVAPAVDGLMHDAFVQRARAEPDRHAVRDGHRQWTYGELDARSNRLARALRQRGVGRGDRVGICLGRDAELLTALMAVLKTGAAYVPLDPSFPSARLAFYAEDAALAWLLTDASAENAPRNWRADAASRVIRLDTDPSWLELADAPLTPTPLDAGPGDAAYVIYTSGSTGRPKGVVVPHRAVASFLSAMAISPGMAPDDRLAAVTTLSFDIAVLELMLPLGAGAEVDIVPRETSVDGGQLRAHLERSGATVMQGTPGLWRMLVDAGWSGGMRFKALAGGEALPIELAHDLLDRAGEVWNLYGPTETTIWSTAWKVDRAVLGERGVAIGSPISGTSVRVVDDGGVECPVGVAGEIRIGGSGVATGYLDRPELTADRFVADPSADDAAARCYRTGDRGRWRNDGLLEHLGRFDFQLKVRGYRIEAGEVEAMCDELPGVSRSVVVAREDQPGDIRLVAYLAAVGGARIDVDALRSRLRERLPDYMSPQHVVVLDALPLLPNGKIDRGALPAPSGGSRSTIESRVRPRNEAERVVLEAIEAVLKLPELGVHDDFFALGGHSLLAARLATRLGSALGVAVPLRTVFEAPTAARLAVATSRLGTGRARDDIEADPSRRRGPLTPMQQRIRFVEELYPGSATYNTPSAHRLMGAMDAAAFGRAFSALIAHQPALRTYVARSDAGDHEQLVADRLAFMLPLIDLSGLPEDRREDALASAMADTVARPLDIHVLPLFHAALFRLDAAHHVLLFVPHHIVWDGWSFDILHEDMSLLYAAELSTDATATAPSAPLPLALSPLDHAHWYARWLDSTDAREQLAYWKHRFASVSAPTPLPVSRVKTVGMVGRGDWLPITIAVPLTERLREASHRAGVTLGVMGMLVLAVLLGSAASSRGVVLGVPVRGRRAGDLDRTMGFFNNLLPIPVDVDPDATIAEAASWLRREMVDAMEQQEIPFERVSAEPEVQAAASASGVYQATYSFQDFRERQTRWGPLTHTRLPIFQRGVTEELGLWLAEHESGMSGALTWDVDVFDRSTAEALHERFVTLLERIADADVASTTLRRLAEFAAPIPGLSADPGASAASPALRRAGGSSPRPLLAGRELLLATAWARLLAIDVADVRATDNFFDLGGDSLLAMRAVEAGAEALGVRVDARRYIYESLAQIASAPATVAPLLRGAVPTRPSWVGRLRAAIGRSGPG